ncbi:MAG TPA: hypothetical protein VIK14_12395 [Ignavibacteria bacterium]
MKRILINGNRDKVNEFETSLETVMNEANRLITVYEAFQPWVRVISLGQFETLCSDPIKLMDQTLQSNSGVDLKSTGGLKPAPEMVAKLLDLNREDYLAIITGKKVSEGCRPCSKVPKIIKQGQGVLNYSTFQNYQDYLLFDQGRFSIKEAAVTLKKESYQIFAQTAAQIECFHFWYNLVFILNSLPDRNYCGDLQAFQSLLKNRVMFSYQTQKLSVDEISLLNEISQLK